VLVGDFPPRLLGYQTEEDSLTQLISLGRGGSALLTHQICSPFAEKRQNTHVSLFASSACKGVSESLSLQQLCTLSLGWRLRVREAFQGVAEGCWGGAPLLWDL